MRVVIANGEQEADYIIKMFKKNRRVKLTVINSNKNYCEYLSKSNGVSVYYGEASKDYVLEDNKIQGADVFIALSDNDCDNFVAALLAKQVYHVKKCICLVTNPKNVDIFKKLGIDSPISSTYFLAETIKSESSVESMIKTLSIEDDRIIIVEIEILEKYAIANKAIMDIGFPKSANISSIFRNPTIIIPNGSTIIRPKDRLIIVSTPQEQDKIVAFIKKEK